MVASRPEFLGPYAALATRKGTTGCERGNCAIVCQGVSTSELIWRCAVRSHKKNNFFMFVCRNEVPEDHRKSGTRAFHYLRIGGGNVARELNFPLSSNRLQMRFAMVRNFSLKV